VIARSFSAPRGGPRLSSAFSTSVTRATESISALPGIILPYHHEHHYRAAGRNAVRIR